MASKPKVIPLADAEGSREHWGKPAWQVYLWAAIERLLVTNAWQISSAVRVAALRAFGAVIGEGVVYRPRTRVSHPWNLSIGDNCWIGEGVWIHNQDKVSIGHDVVISQETFITSGSHAFQTDMTLTTKPIQIGAGTWITSRCVVLGGSVVGESALVTPNSVVRGNLEAARIYGSSQLSDLGPRFND